MINPWIIYGYIWKNDDQLKLLFDVRLQSFWSSKCPLWAVSTKASPDTCWSLTIWQLSPGGQFGNLLQKTFHTREGEFVGVSLICAIGCVDRMALDVYMHAEGVVFSRACILEPQWNPNSFIFQQKKHEFCQSRFLMFLATFKVNPHINRILLVYKKQPWILPVPCPPLRAGCQ